MNGKNNVDILEYPIDSKELITVKSNNCNWTNSNDYKDTKFDLEAFSNNIDKDLFKQPISKIHLYTDRSLKLKTDSHKILLEVFENKEQSSKFIKNIKKDSIKELGNHNIVSKETELLLPYTEPSWSGKAVDYYKLEVLKSGVILKVIDLSKKNYYVIGRLPTCDISMAHPTISRYHAILQFRIVGDEKNEPGMYVYDLESTHGTFWNGSRIKPKMYVRIQGGHILNFGHSQRKFIVEAPVYDQTQESKFSVTELKKEKIFELEQKKILKKQYLMDETKNEKLKQKQDADGINWGMKEDADEETDLTENPYAQTTNEELFLDDPKKSLRGWFEREGYDLHYQVEEKSVGQFLCYIDLPLNYTIGKMIRAEAVVHGKKKEAVVQCALEACRILDKYGLLRQSKHEARKRRTRNWEEEDYYDSEEDNFLDRTGTIEKKRERRMKIAGKFNSTVETYQSLLEKHSKIIDKIKSLQSAIFLDKLKKIEKNDSCTDPLDIYMCTIESTTYNKTNIREMKMELMNLRKQDLQLSKLINKTKPANLPPLKSELNLMKKIKDNLKKNKYTVRQKKSLTKKCKTMKWMEKNEKCENSLLRFKKKCYEEGEQNIKHIKKHQNYFDKNKLQENYSMWLPPENQCGNGKTSLNDKFGY